ncbi:shTK domain protein, partial [Ancylostoma duodenale]
SGGQPVPQPNPNPPQPNPNPRQPNPNPTNCVDKPLCVALIRTRNFCESKVFTTSIKRALCPKSCGFC